MIKKLNLPALLASLRMGSFIGWTLAIMCICQQNLRHYHDDSLLRSVNTTFLTAGGIAGAVLVVILLLLDFDGLLGDRLLKWLPGVLMAEAGIALSLANAGTMTAFAAIAGVAAAVGAMAVFTHLLQVKVGQRMISISLGLAIGGVIRLITAGATAQVSRAGLVTAAAIVGALAVLTVHSRGSTDDHGGILVALAEASPGTIISKVPLVYIILPVLAGAYWLAHSHIQRYAESKLPAGYEGYDTAAFIGFIVAALVAALFVRLSRLALLFAVGTGFAAAAGMLVSLPYLTETEAGVFAMMSYGSLACTRACIYLFIIVFSLDRPHPLFYAMFGYVVATLAELGGVWLDGRIAGLQLSWCIIILILLMPVGGGLLHHGMHKYGFSQEKLDHRKMISGLVRRRSAELELSEREQTMLESIVLEGSGVEELAGHMLFSHNTVKVLLRPVYRKLGASSPEELREQFGQAADSEEAFLAKVHAAEDEKRIADRIKARQERREQREKERREKERQEQEELERKLLEMQTMNQLLGTDEPDVQTDVQTDARSTDAENTAAESAAEADAAESAEPAADSDDAAGTADAADAIETSDASGDTENTDDTNAADDTDGDEPEDDTEAAEHSVGDSGAERADDAAVEERSADTDTPEAAAASGADDTEEKPRRRVKASKKKRS